MEVTEVLCLQGSSLEEKCTKKKRCSLEESPDRGELTPLQLLTEPLSSLLTGQPRSDLPPNKATYSRWPKKCLQLESPCGADKRSPKLPSRAPEEELEQ